MAWSSIFSVNSMFETLRCGKRNSIYLVLLAFKESLFAANHSPILSSSLFMLLLTVISLSLTSVLF